MKKVLFAFAVIATLSFVACNGNKTTSTDVATDSTSVSVDSVKVDSTSATNVAIDTVATDKK